MSFTEIPENLRLIGRHEIAEMFDVCNDTVSNWEREGRLPKPRIKVKRGITRWLLSEVIEHGVGEKTVFRKKTEYEKLKEEAYKVTTEAIRVGNFKRTPCIWCGNEKVDTHHIDYNKPLYIICLCRACHASLHTTLRKIERYNKSNTDGLAIERYNQEVV